MRTGLLASTLATSLLLNLLAGCGGAEERKAEYLSRGKKFFEEHNYDKAKVELKNALQIDPKMAKPYYYLGQIEESKQNWREAFGLYHKAFELDPVDVDVKTAMAKFDLMIRDLDAASRLVGEILEARPGDVDGRLLKAGVASARGETEQAITELEGLIGHGPTRPDAYLVLALLYGKKNDLGTAERMLRQGIDANPGNPALLMGLVQLEQQLKRPQEAEKVLKQLIATDPGNMDYRAALVTFYVQQQRPDDAEKSLRDSIQEDSKDVRRYTMLADFLLRSQKGDRAVEELRRAVEDHPEETSLRFALGQIFEQLRQPERAEAVYREIVDRADDKPDILKAKDRLATLATTKGNTQEAGKLIGEVLEESPRDYQALYLQGRIALMQKDPPKAAATFRSILKDHPDSVEVLTLLATALQLDGKISLAQENLEKAAAVKPEDFVPVKRLIEFLVRQKNRNAAMDRVNAYLAAYPKNLDAWNAKVDLLALDNKPEEQEKALQQIQADFPDRHVGFFRLGQMYQRQQKYDQALVQYESSLSRAEHDYESLKAITAIYLEKKQPEQALARLKKAVAKNPRHPNAYQLLGVYYLSRQQSDEAAGMFRKAIEVNPGWPLPYSNLAAIRPEQAADELDKAIKAYPDDPGFRFALGQLYEQTRQTDKAEALYREIMANRENAAEVLKARERLAALAAGRGDTEEAGKLIAAILVDHPQNFEALYLQGRIALAQKDARKAIATFRAVLKDHPDSVEVLSLLANALQLEGNMAEARESLVKAAAVRPRDFGPVKRLVDFLMQQKKSTEALQELDTYLALDPGNLDAWNTKVDVLASENKYQEVEGLLKQIKAQFPDQAAGPFRLAQWYQNQKRSDEALAEYEDSLNRTEHDYEPLKAITAIYLEKQQPAQALARLKKVVAKNRNHPTVYQLLGMIQLKQNQPDEAIRMFRKAIELNPGWPVPYANLAGLYLSQGDTGNAIQTYDHALKRFPDSVDVLTNLAAIYERAGDSAAAIRKYEEILAKSPDNLMAVNNLASLLSVDAGSAENLKRARDFAQRLEHSAEPAFLDTRAWIAYQSKDYDSALPLMQQACEKMPDEPIFQYHLGMILYKKGDVAGAKEHLAKAIESGKTFGGLQEAKETLTQLN